MKKTVLIFLVVIIMLSATACSKPPELFEVRDELVALLEASYRVNDMLFGDGLVTEYDLSGLTTEYTDELRNNENYFSDSEIFQYYYSPVVSAYLTDGDSDGVSETTVNQPLTIAGIKAEAEKVYTAEMLAYIYGLVFVGETIELASGSAIIRPRYREDTFETGETDANGEAITETVLSKYMFLDENKLNHIASRGGRTVYDYDTMKIVGNSTGELLLVEILGWYQNTVQDTSSEKADEWKSVPSGYSWHTVTLTFVKQAGEWRLDSASY